MNKRKVPKIRFKGFYDDWEQRKLGECLSEITYGFTNPMSDTDDGPWKITAKDIVNGKIDFNAARHTSQGEYDCLTEKSKPRLGDLLLTKDGTLGRIAIVDSVNVCINQSVALLRFNEEYSAQYAKTLLETPMYQRQMLDDAGGGTIKHIYITKVDKMSIPAPSIIEQEKLVYFFRQLDHVITLHQKKCLEWKKRDFTRASISWEQRKLGDHCDMFNGDRSSKYPNAQDMVANGVPFINAGDLVDGHVNLETANKITREKYGGLGGAKLQLGDIVYCLRGTLGKNAYIDNFTEGTVASSLVAIRPKNVDGRYLFHVLNSDIEYRQRIVRDEGAAQPNLSAKSVSEFILPIPDIEEQKKISAFLDGLSNLITLHQRKLELLKRLRNSLIDRCFIGEKYTMSKEILYHGSPNRVIVPKVGFGEDRHDYGRGFYLTENMELAKEWAE